MPITEGAAPRGCPFHRGGGIAAPPPVPRLAAAPRPAGMTRRSLLRGGVLAAAATALAALDGVPPLRRLAFAAPPALPDIQYAIGPYLGPTVLIKDPGAPAEGTVFGFGPTYTLFITAQLTRMPIASDRDVLEQALTTIERLYPFSASGVFTHISYGIPYFNRLPGGMTGPLVMGKMPRLLSDSSRPVLEEAVPGPTDVHPTNPSIRKPRYNIPVRIESNDVLITVRSDNKDNLYDVQKWLAGSDRLNGQAERSPRFGDLFTWTSARLMFGGPGLPRKIADANALPYAGYIHPKSPMWMGFADQVASAFAPPEVCTFQGNATARLTTATADDYFANSSIQVLNHVILDLTEWYLTNGSELDPNGPDVAYLERVQYMYRPHDPPSFGYDDQFTDGGGPTYLPNNFQGHGDAEAGCIFGSYIPGPTAATPRATSAHQILGHISCLHRTSRADDGTPLHIRVDGPGFDDMDVPDGSAQPKLHFSALVPTADLFRRMRVSQASEDLAQKYQVEPGDRGLEGRITATRRQNFLMPRRMHRAFPLLEFVPGVFTLPAPQPPSRTGTTAPPANPAPSGPVPSNPAPTPAPVAAPAPRPPASNGPTSAATGQAPAPAPLPPSR